MNNRTLILFADRHYDAYPGRRQAELLRPLCDLIYIEEDYPALIAAIQAHPGAILAFNSIVGTPGNLTVPDSVEAPLRSHLESGAPLWLLHGGSSAFWVWGWWRQLMPLRWVRNGDPDNAPVSTHPLIPLCLTPTTLALECLPELTELHLPVDENYIKLAVQQPFTTWLTTINDGVVYPQAYSSITPWGGALHGFIPGHMAEVLSHPGYIALFNSIATYWLRK